MYKFTNTRAELPSAYFLLWMMILSAFATGTAFARTPEQIFEKQRHDAKAGYRITMFKLAEMYKDGYGTPQNLAKALEFYKRAAAKRYRRAEDRIIEVEKMIASGNYETTSANVRMAQIRQEIEELEREYKQLEQLK